MKKSFVIAALLAATAFTPAFAQEEPQEARVIAEVATAAEPTPIPQRVEAQMAQRERGERGPRAEGGDAPRPQWGGGQGGGGQNGGVDRSGGQRGAEGGWQRSQAPAPVYQAPVYQAPVQQAPSPQSPPTAPVRREWNRSDGGGAGWQGGQRPDWSARNANPQGGQPGWTRPTPPAATAPASPPPQGNWQNREQRRDTWQGQGNRQGNGTSTGVGGFPQRDNRTLNGDNGWNGQNRNDPRRNDTWQNGQTRNDTWRNQGQWNRDGRQDRWGDQARNNGRNEGWRNDGRRNDTWRNDSWRNNNRYDQRSQWQNQYRGWDRNWSRDWRRDQRYDWQRYRSSNRDLFYGDRYYAPYGWNYGYRRFSIGFSLSYVLYDQQYWIDDPYNYRLPPVYGPYRWVRYYDDVLLVDLRTGQVVDAIYDFFW